FEIEQGQGYAIGFIQPGQSRFDEALPVALFQRLLSVVSGRHSAFGYVLKRHLPCAAKADGGVEHTPVQRGRELRLTVKFRQVVISLDERILRGFLGVLSYIQHFQRDGKRIALVALYELGVHVLLTGQNSVNELQIINIPGHVPVLGRLTISSSYSPAPGFATKSAK